MDTKPHSDFRDTSQMQYNIYWKRE
jgi:hypothetical protein